jgi:AcrR family transcriptional regulator
MARKPTQPKKAAKGAESLDAIVAAAMALAAERDWREIGLTDIAEAAGVSLADLLAQYPSKLAILDGFTRTIDRRVLAEFEPESESVSVRDRLFDVLMRRFDVLEPHKAAVGRIAGAACRDPLIGVATGCAVLRSMGLMLEAAGVPSDGMRGIIRRKGLAAMYGATLRDWLKDDTADKSRTMAALDGRLRRAEGWVNSLKSSPFGRQPSASSKA